jgi:hypothetical protein
MPMAYSLYVEDIRAILVTKLDGEFQQPVVIFHFSDYACRPQLWSRDFPV